MHAHVQRLASSDDDIAGTVLFDVTSVLATAGTTNEFWRTVDAVIEACRRGGRALVCVVAPASGSPRVKFIDALVASAHGFSSASLHQFFTELRCRRLTTVYSASEPLPSLAYAGSPAKCHVSLVLGGVADHDCWCLARRTAHAGEQAVASILDLGTGRLWRREDVIGSPEVVARAEAILRSATRQYPARYKTTVAVQLDAGIPVLADRAAYEAALTRLPAGRVGSPLPMWLTTPWAVPASKKSRTLVQHEVDAEERRLRGWDRPSDKARAALASAIISTTKPRSTTGYICAVVNRGAASWTLESVVCRLEGRWVHAEGAATSEVLRQFRKEFPERWFGPRIVDLLAWMKRHRIMLPARAADPAWAAFVLDPEVDTDHPLDLAGYSSSVLRLSTQSRSWLGDIKRNAPPPATAEALQDAARALPVLDRNLRATAGEGTALRRLLDDDIEPTLTTLAGIEGRGIPLAVPVGCADWFDFGVALDGATNVVVGEARALLRSNVDFFRDAKLTVRAIEKSVGVLLPAEKGMPMNNLLRRYLEVFDDLEPLRRARALGALSAERPFIEETKAGATTVHPITVPQSSGRLGLLSPRLQSLPKDAPEGLILRSALAVPDGWEIIACDYNAFEARLAADLSGDPVLFEAAQGTDLFIELADLMFCDRSKRGLAKSAFYAILFGQTQDQFWKKMHVLARGEADVVYETAVQRLHHLLDFRERKYREIDWDGFVQTRGGWHRTLHAPSSEERRRQGFSVIVQGLAADIMRRVVRTLEEQLGPFDAGVIGHVHDELYVATPAHHVTRVEQIMLDVMTMAARSEPVLVAMVPLIVKPPRRGRTWADVR